MNTGDDLLRTLEGEARRVVALGNKRDRWLRMDGGGAPPPLPEDQKFSMFAPGWQSRVTYGYSVDVVPDRSGVVVRRGNGPDVPIDDRPPRLLVWRHLSIQTNSPGALDIAAVNANAPALQQLYAPQVMVFFPLHTGKVRVQWQVSDPVVVQRPGRLANGHREHPLSMRTVVTAHFVVGWNGQEEYEFDDDGGASVLH